jgi:hypothetical protein
LLIWHVLQKDWWSMCSRWWIGYYILLLIWHVLQNDWWSMYTRYWISSSGVAAAGACGSCTANRTALFHLRALLASTVRIISVAMASGVHLQLLLGGKHHERPWQNTWLNCG